MILDLYISLNYFSIRFSLASLQCEQPLMMLNVCLRQRTVYLLTREREKDWKKSKKIYVVILNN